MERLSADLASLRALVVADPFVSSKATAGTRRVAVTVTSHSTVVTAIHRCPATAELGERLDGLLEDVKQRLATSQDASIYGARTQRQVAADLYQLLPIVVALARDTAAIGDEYGLQIAALPGPSMPSIGKLPPLPTPTPKPTPRPTPKPPAPATATTIKASYFGAGAKIKTYRVAGSTPQEISGSIHARGPRSEWLKGRAAATTGPRVSYRFHFASDGYGSCRIVVEKKPPVLVRFTITLPGWKPSSGTPAATVTWWNDSIRNIARHEKHHVAIYRQMAKTMNRAVGSSACSSLQRKLDSASRTARRANCEFDMKEYGAASGLSLKACLAR